MGTAKVKIVHVIDSLRMGGAETLILNTIRELTEFEHVLIALNKPEDLKDKLPAGTKYYRLRFNFKWTFIGTLFRLKKIIRAEAPHIIHAHLFWSIILARLAGRKGTKFIFTLHGMMGSRLFKRRGLYRFMEKITLSSTQHLVAVSKTVYDDYIRYIPFRGTAHIIYNYVPDDYFKNEKKSFAIGEVFRVVTVGSLRAIKNQEVIIKAIAELGEGYSLDIYGYGDMEEKLRKMAYKLDARVFFQGSQKDICKLLPGYDLFVMTSFSEGHSIALLEAMALKLPLLLSDIPSFRETTRGKSLFYSVSDEKELADKIREMRENESLRRQIAENCHSVVLQEATREKYLANIRCLYEANDTGIPGELTL